VTRIAEIIANVFLPFKGVLVNKEVKGNKKSNNNEEEDDEKKRRK